MSLKKRYLKSKPICKVTFEIPKSDVANAATVHLVGEFNNWDTETTPLARRKAGDFSVTLDLEVGQRYEFRYLLDGERWLNDQAADAYVNTPFPGIENSVVVV